MTQGIFWGIITAAAFILAAVKYVTARLGNPGADRLALKLHRYAGSVLLIGSIIHVCKVWKFHQQYPPIMTVVGIMMLAAVFATLVSHMLSRQLGKRWLVIHRAATLVIAAGLIVHVIIAVFFQSGMVK